jgi:Spermine/spermidine synthase domain
VTRGETALDGSSDVTARGDDVPAAPRVRWSTYAGLFMVTLATLMYEIGLTRIFSVTTFYHFAFVAISLALFGLTAGALLVYLVPNLFPDDRVPQRMWLAAILFAISIPICLAIQLSIRFDVTWSFNGVLSVVGTCAIASVPFVLSGIVVCLALTRFPDRINRLYAVDLLGAGIGCLLLAVVFNAIDGPSALIAVAALAGVGSLFFALRAGQGRAVGAAVLVVVLLSSLAVFNALRARDGVAPISIVWTKGVEDSNYIYETWNSFSRVTIAGNPDLPATPFGWGLSTTLPPSERVRQLEVGIDSIAGTNLTGYSGDEHESDFLRYDITNLVHYLRPHSKVLVIGVGGGRDVLSALEFKQKSVTGVEINGKILELLKGPFADFTGHIATDPRVTLVNDEARSYLTRTDNKYDIIEISLIDTFAATTAGAFALSENSLYTTEAWGTFFDRLTPDGVLSVSRWYQLGPLAPLETYRTVALAAQALTDRGVKNPRDHILVYHSPTEKGFTVATVLVSPNKPFTAADLAKMSKVTGDLQFPAVLTPDTAIGPEWAGLARPGGPDKGLEAFDEDIAPPTDNRPFFFQMANFDNLVEGKGLDDPRVTRPVKVLGLLALAVLVLTILFIGIPLLITTRRSAHKGMTPFYIYFAGIGLGFLLVEFSQVLRLSVFLGHPIYALVIVLFSILLFSGIGSMLSERFVNVDRSRTLLGPLALLLAVIAVFGLATVLITDAAASATTPVRILVAVALLMPIGLVMGMPLAIGMRMASTHPNAPTSFLWGINGATSVCASVFGMAIALFFGISAAFWTGWVAYGIAVLAMVVAVRKAARTTGIEPVDPEPVAEPVPVDA